MLAGDDACGLLHNEDEEKTTLVSFFSPFFSLNTFLWSLLAKSEIGDELEPPVFFGSLTTLQLTNDNPGSLEVGWATSLNVARLVKNICLSWSDIRKFALKYG